MASFTVRESGDNQSMQKLSRNGVKAKVWLNNTRKKGYILMFRARKYFSLVTKKGA